MTRDVDVPQCGLDDVEGADISFLDPVVRAEPPPTPRELTGIAILVEQKAHLPWPVAMILVRSCPERDLGRPPKPDRLAEIPRNRLQ